MPMDNEMPKGYSYYPQNPMPYYGQPESQFEQNNPGMMPGMVMQPNMVPGPMYNQNSVQMPYYGGMPMNQNMPPNQAMMQPGMVPGPGFQQMPQDMPMGQPGYYPQMMPNNNMQMSGQPMYQMYYPHQNQAPMPGQYNNQF